MGINSESKHLKDECFSCHLKEKVKIFVENSKRKNKMIIQFSNYCLFTSSIIGFPIIILRFLNNILGTSGKFMILRIVFMICMYFSQRIFDEKFYFFFQMEIEMLVFKMLRFRFDSHNSSRNYVLITFV